MVKLSFSSARGELLMNRADVLFDMREGKGIEQYIVLEDFDTLQFAFVVGELGSVSIDRDSGTGKAVTIVEIKVFAIGVFVLDIVDAIGKFAFPLPFLNFVIRSLRIGGCVL